MCIYKRLKNIYTGTPKNFAMGHRNRKTKNRSSTSSVVDPIQKYNKRSDSKTSLDKKKALKEMMATLEPFNEVNVINLWKEEPDYQIWWSKYQELPIFKNSEMIRKTMLYCYPRFQESVPVVVADEPFIRILQALVDTQVFDTSVEYQEADKILETENDRPFTRANIQIARQLQPCVSQLEELGKNPCFQGNYVVRETPSYTALYQCVQEIQVRK